MERGVKALFEGKRNRQSGAAGVEAGLANGRLPGHLGLWAIWKPNHTLTEVYRAIVTAKSAGSNSGIQFTYTFAPAFDAPFCRSLEMPLAFKNFLVGTNRAEMGTLSVELWLANGATIHLSLRTDKILPLYRGRGFGSRNAPDAAPLAPGYQTVDSPQIASMPREKLKAYSDKVRQELEEKRLKDEAERKAREEAEALAKAAAEKAAADKAAAAAAKAAAAKAPGGALPPSGGPSLAPAKVGIFFGSSTGNTEDVAGQIKSELGDVVDYVKNITEISPADLTVCENLILGVPTWHIGEMQDDWAVILPEVAKLNFSGKKVAVFGLGDGKGYPETYVDAMQELLEKFEKTGAKLVGLWPTEGYLFSKSKAIRDGKFLGLVIDVENQNDMTDKRVKTWVAQIRKELAL